MPHEDRRQKRSDDPLIALHYQLAHARTRGALEAIVVADSAGVVVAGAGSWAACEELAAYAPLLARTRREADAAGLADLADAADTTKPPSRVEALRLETAVTWLSVDDQEVLVCVRGAARADGGGATRSDTLAATTFGVARILGAAA